MSLFLVVQSDYCSVSLKANISHKNFGYSNQNKFWYELFARHFYSNWNDNCEGTKLHSLHKVNLNNLHAYSIMFTFP